MIYIYISIIISAIALIGGGILILKVQRRKVENEKAKEISRLVYKGAMSFLNKEYKVLIIFVILIGAILYFLIGSSIIWAFLGGVVFSALAGNISMRVATLNNARTAEAAKKSLKKGLEIAFGSGSVIGMVVVGLGLLGVSLFYLIFGDPQVIFGFSLGASIVALFTRVGGGIYAKAADIRADSAGKIEAGAHEDSSRNPAAIADIIGDNVCDVAGMGSDLFESYVDVIIAAMFIGSLGLLFPVSLPLFLAGLGIIAAIIGNTYIRLFFKDKLRKKKTQDCKLLERGVLGATIPVAVFSLFAIKFITGHFLLFWPFLIGLIGAIGIGLIIKFYTSYNYKPTRKVAISAQAGPSANILNGVSLGTRSTLFPVLIISLVIFLAYSCGGIYGIAIAAIGMLSILGTTLAINTCGPVIDNAASIAEMTGMSQEAGKNIEKLDAMGNTIVASGKGLAMGAAALTALVLLISYSLIAKLSIIDLLAPKTIIGLFIGGLIPFLFSSFMISSANKAAMKIIQEIRRQFKKINGRLEGKAETDHTRCISIGTKIALKEMIIPGLLVIIMPVLIGFLLGPEALGGLLTASIVVGFLGGITMTTSGASWDNAKKYIELGNLGGKGSESHKAAMIGDTIGDSFKDVAGPSLNILLKLMAVVALIIAPFL